MTDNFYYDLFSLQKLNIRKWSQNFYWPLNPKKTQDILIKILHFNKQIVSSEKHSFIRNCFTVYNQTWNPYVTIFNYLLFRKNIPDKKNNLIFSQKSRVMTYLESDDSDFPIKVETFNIRHRKFSKLKDEIKSFIFNFKNRRNINRGGIDLVLNNKDLLSSEVFSKNKRKVKILSLETLMENYENYKISSKNVKLIKLLSKVNYLHNVCMHYAKNKLRIIIPSFVENDLRNFQEKYFSEIYRLLSFLEKNKKLIILNNNSIFLSTPKTLIKAISVVAKEKGIKVNGILHGNWMCHSKTIRPHFNEFMIYDLIYIDKNSHKPLFNKTLNSYKTFNLNKPIFKSLESNKYNNLKKKYKTQIPKVLNSVMILEVQLWCDDVRFDLPESMIIYEFYFRLCVILDSLGYKIFFKKRPKSQKIDYLKFFKGIKNIQIIYDDIQNPEVMKLADTVIFVYGLSSTFLPLMCSNKKLIYFDCGWEKWHKDVMQLVKKRCEVIDAKYDNKNRIRFNQRDLKIALSPNKKHENKSFFEKYLN